MLKFALLNAIIIKVEIKVILPFQKSGVNKGIGIFKKVTNWQQWFIRVARKSGLQKLQITVYSLASIFFRN